MKRLLLILYFSLFIFHFSFSQTHAQMYIKGQVGEEGFTPITAEGKHYAVKSVTEQTFGPNDKSFNLMQHHGVAFESEIMAYRLYFDKRQTVDIYAKKTPRLELQESMWYPNDSLLAEGYGDDILRVGNEIGVGTPRFVQNGELLKMDKFKTRTQRIVKQTPDSVVVEMEVIDLLLKGETEPLDMRVRYTLLAKHRDPLCEVWLSHQPQHSVLATGVMRIGMTSPNPSKGGETQIVELAPCPWGRGMGGKVLSSWGTDWPVNDTVKYAKETVGLAVCIPAPYAGNLIPNDKNLLCELRLRPVNSQSSMVNCQFHLTCVALKENNPPAHNAKQFFRFARRWGKSLK